MIGANGGNLSRYMTINDWRKEDEENECPDYPCADVVEKETRYTSKYPLYESPGKNLHNIRKLGMEKLLESEREQLSCKECDHIISVHTGICSGCGKQYGAQIA